MDDSSKNGNGFPPLTQIDSQETLRYGFDEANRAHRVIVVAGTMPTINVEATAQPAASQSPQIEIKEIQVPQIIVQKELEIKEIQIPQIIVQKELEVKEIKIPQIVIQKEVELKEVEKVVIVREPASSVSIINEPSRLDLGLRIAQLVLLGIITLALFMHK